MVIAFILLLYDNILSKIDMKAHFICICVQSTHLVIILLILVVRKLNTAFFSRVCVFFLYKWVESKKEVILMNQQLKIGTLLLIALLLAIFITPIATLFYNWTFLSPFIWRLLIAFFSFVMLCIVLVMAYRQKSDKNYVLYYATLLFMLALTPRLIYSVAFG